MPGRLDNRTLIIRVSGPSLPAAPPKRIDLQILVAGREFDHSLPAVVNERYTFTWDGKDAYGQTLQGPQAVTIRIGYVYDAVYIGDIGSQSFNADRITVGPARTEITLWAEEKASLGRWNARAVGLGGWSLNAQHVYDPGGRVLYLGDGSQRSATSPELQVINTLTRIGSGCPQETDTVGDGCPVAQATVYSPWDVKAGPDGSLYIVSSERIRRVAPNGIITTVAGNGTPCSSSTSACGDGGPATQAQLYTPESIAVGPDGSLYIADSERYRIRRVELDGIITTVAGNGQECVGGGGRETGCGDGGQATDAKLYPGRVAIGPDGSLYIAEAWGPIRRVGTDGIITTVAGGGQRNAQGMWCAQQTDDFGDGCPATQAQVNAEPGIAVGPDGSLYIADYSRRIRRVGPDGIITAVAGSGDVCLDLTTGCGDGGPATQASLRSPNAITVAPDGSVYFGDAWLIRRVGPDGIITAMAGNPSTYGSSGDGGPATQAAIERPEGLVVEPDGALTMANTFNVRQIAPALPGLSLTDSVIPSQDGGEFYVFDSTGRHLETLDALTDALRYRFSYDTAGRLTAVTDGYGNVTTIQRDSSGNPVAIIAPGGQKTVLTLDANGYLAGVTDPAGDTTRLFTSPDGLLSTFTDPRGGVHHMTYDALGRLIKDADPAGGSTSLARTDSTDGSGSYAVTMTSALGHTETYALTFLPTSDRQIVRTFTDGTRVTELIHTDGSSTLSYPDGTKIALVYGPDPRWGMLAPTMDETITTPSGLTYVQSESRSVSLSDPNNLVSLSGSTETVTENNKAWSVTYNANNASNPAGPRTLTDQTPTGRQKTVTLDAHGQVIQEEEQGIAPFRYTYDAHGRLATFSQGSRAYSVRYNPDWTVSSATDPLGHITRFGYDLAGRATSETLPDSTSQIHFGYDANGNLASLTPPGRSAYTFAYSPVDLLQSSTAPSVGASSSTAQYTSNPDRQLTQITRPDGSTITTTYDAGAHPRTRTTPQGQISYSRDVTTGLLTGLTTSGEQLDYSYDGALDTGTTWTGTVAGSVGKGYDNSLRVVSRSVDGATSIASAYDGDGLLTGAGQESLSYDSRNGMLAGTTLGNVSDTYGYSPFGELAGYTAQFGGTALFSAQYTLDGLAQATQKTETIGGVSHTYGYSYDADGRLTGVTEDGSVLAQYAYDANGNRTSITQAGRITRATYDAQDRLLSDGSTTYSYTPNGDLKTATQGGKTSTYTHDAQGNLTGVTLPDGTRIGYLVDGAGRRIGTTLNGTLTQGLLYQSDLHPIAELDGNNQVVSRFVYGSKQNVPDYLIKGGTTYRIISDELGTVRLVVDTQTGQVVQEMEYDPFGKVIKDTNPGFQPFGFAGGLYDRETGLVHLGARDYDPSTGRWIEQDPISFAGGSTNLYVYAGNDPVNWIDPSGDDPAIAPKVPTKTPDIPVGTHGDYKGEVNFSYDPNASYPNPYDDTFNAQQEQNKKKGQQDAACGQKPSDGAYYDDKKSDPLGPAWKDLLDKLKGLIGIKPDSNPTSNPSDPKDPVDQANQKANDIWPKASDQQPIPCYACKSGYRSP